MPTYTYECPEHGQFDLFRRVAEMTKVESCPVCSLPSEKIIVPSYVVPDYAEYACPITGKPIRGKREHSENLKKHGCRVFEPGETQDFIRRKDERQRQSDREIDRLVESAYRSR